MNSHMEPNMYANMYANMDAHNYCNSFLEIKDMIKNIVKKCKEGDTDNINNNNLNDNKIRNSCEEDEENEKKKKKRKEKKNIFRKNMLKNIMHSIENNENLLDSFYLEKLNFYHINYITRFIYICCYNIINNEKEYLIKYDSIPYIETEYKYNYYEYSDVNYYKNYLSDNICNNIIKSNYVTIVSILIHMNILNIHDIWSVYLLKLIENNNFFHILNFLMYKKKNVLFYLTISSFLKINYEFVLYSFPILTEQNKINEDILFSYVTEDEHINIDVYIKFVEKYNNKNNTYIPSFLNYKLIQAFLLFFKYSWFCKILVCETCDVYENSDDTLKRSHDIFEDESYNIKNTYKYNYKYKKKYKQYMFECKNKRMFHIPPYIKHDNMRGQIFNSNEKINKNKYFINHCSDNYIMCNNINYDDLRLCTKLHNIENFDYFKNYYSQNIEPYIITDTNKENERENSFNIILDKKKKENFNEYYSNYIIFIILKFFENNNIKVICYFYTLLMYCIAKLHLSNNYRFKEINYLYFLHILPWKTSLHFCIKDSHLSCFFFQKFYECVQNLLPEIVIEHFHDRCNIPSLSFQMDALIKSFKNEKISRNSKGKVKINIPQGDNKEEHDNIYKHVYMDDPKYYNNDGGEHNIYPNEYENKCITHDTQKNVEENNCFHELDKKNIEKMNLYEQIIYGKHIIKKIFFLLDASECHMDIITYLNNIFDSSLLKNCLLINTFIHLYFLNSPMHECFIENNFIEMIQNIFDEQACSYYISIFQNPLNFFLKCTNKFCEVLVHYDCLDNLISFIFTKLYNYLSLIPPKISPDDFLPLNVEDITSLQETAVAQFVMNLKREDIQKNKTEENYTINKDPNKEKCVDNKNVKADDNTVELNKSTNFIFEDLKFFLKKMDIFVKTFNINSLNSICESGFNSKSAFFLCFYMTPSIFANIFYYLNNNITAIVNESFNLEENIKYYEHVHVKKTEYTLEPYNIIDKTVFYFQIVVFYLIINTNNVLMDNSNYLENVCSFFSKCLKVSLKDYIDKLIIAITPIMLQYFYFFPSFIPSIITTLSEMPKHDNEFSKHMTKLENKLKIILECSYKYLNKEDSS
ncbi:hypothetical protein PFDG_03121 [Plasmodium falciparum Dd2]|uniref:Uncharacterized protein n=1 Tax=Plasmodium falciparum (isolate Dd2) TaxID=57267 RepID=A0A0L7M7R5_PLAF4|nr:hypothetical protein PFDG_03121 [Plasmodium falciparum Dd2]